MYTTILRSNTGNIFEMLLKLCEQKGFKVTQKNFENRTIKAKKGSLFFWKNLYLELQLFVFSNEDDVVKVSVKIFRANVLQHELEEKFIEAINKTL